MSRDREGNRYNNTTVGAVRGERGSGWEDHRGRSGSVGNFRSSVVRVDVWTTVTGAIDWLRSRFDLSVLNTSSFFEDAVGEAASGRALTPFLDTGV